MADDPGPVGLDFTLYAPPPRSPSLDHAMLAELYARHRSSKKATNGVGITIPVEEDYVTAKACTCYAVRSDLGRAPSVAADPHAVVSVTVPPGHAPDAVMYNDNLNHLSATRRAQAGKRCKDCKYIGKKRLPELCITFVVMFGLQQPASLLPHPLAARPFCFIRSPSGGRVSLGGACCTRFSFMQTMEKTRHGLQPAVGHRICGCSTYKNVGSGGGHRPGLSVVDDNNISVAALHIVFY